MLHVLVAAVQVALTHLTVVIRVQPTVVMLVLVIMITVILNIIGLL